MDGDKVTRAEQAEAFSGPLVSVVIPLFNGAHTIRDAISSVTSQSLQDWEILVVDDCSLDQSVTVVRDLIDSNHELRIRLIQLSTNSGPSHARNVGVKQSNGEYVCFLDADDALMPGALEHLTSLCRSSGSDIASGTHMAVTQQGTEQPRPDRVSGQISGVEAVNALLQERIWNFNHGRLYRKEILTQVSHDERARRYEDLIFNAAAFSYSSRLVFSEVPVYRYRISSGSTTWSQQLATTHVTDTERLLREGLKPEVLPLVSQKSWRTMRAVLAVVVYSGALVSSADPAVQRDLRRVLRDSTPLPALIDVATCAPTIAISALLARMVPGLYAKLYRTHVQKSYELQP